MLIKIKSRYKPVYKKFIRLRKNVQNKKKVSLGFFKKKKWKNLNKFLRRQTYRRKKKFRAYDLTNYHIKKYGSKFKRSFLMNLLNKQGFSLFYGSIKNKHIKKLVFRARKTSIQKKKAKVLTFFKLIELRLDTVLYRSHFTKSIREAKFLIKHGHINVNNLTVLNNNLTIGKGDCITTSNKINTVVKYNILSSNMWPIPPENYIINYKIFSICIVDNTNLNTLYNKFPFYFSISKLINYYN